MEKGDPGELSPVFEAFQNEDQLFFSEVSMGHYRYLSHCVADLLLIDRPPPIWKPELINFA